MADGDGGGNALLGLIVGGLLVVVALFFVFGGIPGTNKTADVNISVPKISTPAK